MAIARLRREPTFRPEQQLYQAYSTDEDARRSRLHYEHPTELFYPILGGEWNVYSCNLWPQPVMSDTAAQEAKLDLLARLMQLQPGQRVLDVGCGWGGPLVYLCQRYGVRGVGLTVSPMQKRAAETRIARYGVDARIVEAHWRDFEDDEGFDVICSDEVIVHFNDLAGFFAKAHTLLHKGGRQVHKELHFTHRGYSRMTRGLAFVNEFFGGTGNYRTLADELTLLGEAGFEVQRVEPIPLTHYHQTLARWLANARAHREALEQVVGPDHYQRFRRYLKLVRHVFGGPTMTLDVVVSRKSALD